MKIVILLTVVAVAATHSVQYGSHGFGGTHGGVTRPGGGNAADYEKIVFPDSDSFHESGLPSRPGGGVRPVRPGGGGRPVRPGGGGQLVRPGGGGGPVGPGVGVGAGLGPIGGGPEGILSLRQCKPYIRPQVHFELNGREYHFSWCSDNGRKYTWQVANNYCKNLGSGWAGVSIETEAENKYITEIIDRHQLPYIWTSGNRLNAPQKTNVYNWVWAATGERATYYNWGLTGMVPGRPQPDNNENNNEQCLSVINRFYPGDGITWHDIGCHHEKPIICERQPTKYHG